MATQLPQLGDSDRISPRVIRILGGNPSKYTLQGTNTYLIGTGPQRILIDTGEGLPQWSHNINSVAKAQGGIQISHTLLTHWHRDHVSGCPDVHSAWPDANIYKNAPGAGQNPITDGQIFKVEGATLRAFHCPGHTTDHMAFVLEEEDAMFTGDNVLGHGTSVFEDYTAYMTSLERMRKQFSGRAYPGHGDVIDDGRGKIGEYIAHRKEREDEILGVLLLARDWGGGASPREIVEVVYQDYPESLHEPAMEGVKLVLGKLEEEGKVRRDRGGRWWIGGKGQL